jgi:DNA-directed RNA polymerase I, II, and III subunit RPABC2
LRNQLKFIERFKFIYATLLKKDMSEEFAVKIGPPRLTKYEFARIVGARALMLSFGAPSFVQGNFKNTFEMAEYEIRQKVLPIIIRRSLPTNEYQDVPLRFLNVPII